ncbi:hypothetical protein ACVH9Z_17220 [Rhodococcus opacus]|uniref:hypothetical protein n=1 Tax=Rhodococcus opacus TaxID=37919 RepID=UPI003D11AA55
MGARVGEEPVLATGGDDGTVQLWDPHRGEPRTVFFPGGTDSRTTGRTLWGAWARVDDEPVLATGGDDGTVALWDQRGQRDHRLAPLDALRGGFPTRLGLKHTGAVQCGAWARLADEPVLATGGDDAIVRLWSLNHIFPQPIPLIDTGPVLWGAWARVGEEPD